MRECASGSLPSNAIFHQEDIIGNSLPRAYFDAVLLLSTLEHIGLPHYNVPFGYGDRLALSEVGLLLKPEGSVIVTVPAGYNKVCSWYRQYSPNDLHRLFANWHTEITYWGFTGTQYEVIDEGEVERFDYRISLGAGAVAGIKASKKSIKAVKRINATEKG